MVPRGSARGTAFSESKRGPESPQLESETGTDTDRAEQLEGFPGSKRALHHTEELSESTGDRGLLRGPCPRNPP